MDAIIPSDYVSEKDSLVDVNPKAWAYPCLCLYLRFLSEYHLNNKVHLCIAVTSKNGEGSGPGAPTNEDDAIAAGKTISVNT